jgi:hypothetical protein
VRNKLGFVQEIVVGKWEAEPTLESQNS